MNASQDAEIARLRGALERAWGALQDPTGTWIQAERVVNVVQ